MYFIRYNFIRHFTIINNFTGNVSCVIASVYNRVCLIGYKIYTKRIRIFLKWRFDWFWLSVKYEWFYCAIAFTRQGFTLWLQSKRFARGFHTDRSSEKYAIWYDASYNEWCLCV